MQYSWEVLLYLLLLYCSLFTCTFLNKILLYYFGFMLVLFTYEKTNVLLLYVSKGRPKHRKT